MWGASLQLRSRTEEWKSSEGEKVVVVEGMVVEEGSGRVEEKRKEKKS